MKTPKQKFTCSDCGFEYFRESFEVCPECPVSVKKLQELIEKRTSLPWIKIRSDGVNERKERKVKILGGSGQFLITVAYDTHTCIIYEVCTITTVKINIGYSHKKRTEGYETIYKRK